VHIAFVHVANLTFQERANMAVDSGASGAHPLPDIDDLWRDDPVAAEQRLRLVVPAAERAGDPAYLAELAAQIARAWAMQGRFDDCHKLLDKAQRMLSPQMQRPSARCLLERGRALLLERRTKEAQAVLLEAWQSARASRHYAVAADAAHLLASVDEAEPLAWRQRAVELAEQAGVEAQKPWFGQVVLDIGMAQHESGHFERALQYFRRAQAWEHRHGHDAAHRRAKWWVARTLRSLGRAAEALEKQRELMLEYEAAGHPSAMVYEEMAHCLAALGREDEARAWMSRAHRHQAEEHPLGPHT